MQEKYLPLNKPGGKCIQFGPRLGLSDGRKERGKIGGRKERKQRRLRQCRRKSGWKGVWKGGKDDKGETEKAEAEKRLECAKKKRKSDGWACKG